ncbi:MAG TPA: L-lactate permease [Actinomycetes bacterium]|nr:L-lactate permease [Actinomycetes bacterium]
MLAAWNQRYEPVADNLALSALVAALPVIVLLGLLGLLRVRAHYAALAGLATALLVALLVYGMPAPMATAALVNGALFGLFPIGWIVLTAMFVYDITVATGAFEVVKGSIAGMASDRRIQVLLIAFCFGAFLEGSAGFGTPVAMSAAMLIGLGFRPVPAAGLSLIGNTAPVAFGAIGTPILTLAGVTNLPVDTLSAMVGRQLPFFALIVPFWLVWALAGRKATLEVWPAALTAGASFGLVQFLVSNFIGPELVDILASLVSIGSLLLLVRFWQPRSIWRFEHERDDAPSTATQRPEGPGAANRRSPTDTPALARQDTRRAWVPWVMLGVSVLLWGLPQVKGLLNDIYSASISVPFLDMEVVRVPPVVATPSPTAAVFAWTPLSATGTALLFTAIGAALYLRLRPGEVGRILLGTLRRVKTSLLTIAAMLAIAYTSRFAGLDASMGLAFASTGALFAFFSPLLGWLGVALTGSDTSSNALFGNLQQITAQQAGLSPVLTTAANSSGGVMAKMIDAQSIVVAGVATGQQSNEGEILRYGFWHAVALGCLMGVLVFLQSNLLSWMIPG